jgi:penicillin-binding protein A
MWLAPANLGFLVVGACLYWMARRWMLRVQAPGRNLELRACVLTAMLTVGGFALAHVGMNYSLTGQARLADYQWLVFALAFSATLLVAHLLLRLQRSRVDQILLPVAAFLVALGLINIYVWETRDSNAYVSTVALPALRDYQASIANDRSTSVREKRASLESIGPVPNELDYERNEDNRSHNRFATVLNSGWLETYNSSVKRLHSWLRARPERSVDLPVHEVRLYGALKRQLLVALACLLLIPGLLFARRYARLLSHVRVRDPLWAGGLVLLLLTGALLLQSNAARLPAGLRVGDNSFTLYDPLKLGLIVVLALAIGRVVIGSARLRQPAVVFGSVAAAATVAVMLLVDFGSGVVLLAITAFMIILVTGRRSHSWILAYGSLAVCIAPIAVSSSGFPIPDTARDRLEMWADPWKTYQRAEVRNVVTKSAKRIVQRRVRDKKDSGPSPTGHLSTTQSVSEPRDEAKDMKRIASLIRSDVSHIEQDLRWRLEALETNTPNAAPFVPGPDPGEVSDLLESEKLWSELGGYSSDRSSEKQSRFFEGAVNDAIAQLKADTDRHIWWFRANGGLHGAGPAYPSGEPPQPTNFQVQRSLFALRAGGAIGVGLGLGKPEALPAMTEDVPLASLGEALGFAGVAIIALLILLITVRGIEHGRNKDELTHALMMVGLAAAFGLQAFLGMGAISGVLPFSGLTFPFLSRSGTALLVNFGALTLMMALSVSPPAARDAPERGLLAGGALGRGRILKGAGFPAAFAVALASLACVQLAGRMLAPGSLLAALPEHSSPIHHAEDLWERPSYRMALGPIVDRRGKILAKTTSLGEKRSYPDPQLADTLAQTLPQLDSSFRDQLTGAVGDSGEPDRTGQSPPIGPALVTTVESDLQRAVHEAFDRGAAEGGLGGVQRLRGAAVVLDARSGDILALDSRPTFSLNELSENGAWVNAEAADRRLGLPYRYLNRVVHGYYPPGSIFKTITAAAGLETGLHTLHSHDFDYRSGVKGPRPPDGLLQLGRWHQLPLADGPPITTGNHPDLKDWRFNLETAYAWSCNVAFAELGLELGPGKLIQFARRFGFERRIEVPGLGAMTSTLDNDQGEAPASRYLARTSSNLARTAFGQAQVRTTPLQMALATAAIANGGHLMQPRLVAGWKTHDGQWLEKTPVRVLQSTGLSETTLKAMREMMHASTTYGWARRASLNRRNSNPGVAGKTGSAEWSEERDAAHSWFIGYFPSESPRIALALVVERGGLGPTVAVRVARQIFGAPELHSYVEKRAP